MITTFLERRGISQEIVQLLLQSNVEKFQVRSKTGSQLSFLFKNHETEVAKLAKSSETSIFLVSTHFSEIQNNSHSADSEI